MWRTDILLTIIFSSIESLSRCDGTASISEVRWLQQKGFQLQFSRGQQQSPFSTVMNVFMRIHDLSFILDAVRMKALTSKGLILFRYHNATWQLSEGEKTNPRLTHIIICRKGISKFPLWLGQYLITKDHHYAEEFGVVIQQAFNNEAVDVPQSQVWQGKFQCFHFKIFIVLHRRHVCRKKVSSHDGMNR